MKNKRIVSILLMFVLLLSVCPVGLFGITVGAETSGYFTYTLSNGEATITDCNMDISGDITIPENFGRYPVTGIGDYAFYCCRSLKSVKIPESVTSIGRYAFYYCSDLTSVSLPNNITSIGNFAFDSCYNLKYNIYKGGKYLGNEKKNYLALINAVDTDIISFEFADDVKIIYYGAFRNCEDLASIIIPNSIISIGDYAFSGCRNLISVSIGNGVKNIGEQAFCKCYNLTSITIPYGVTNISAYTFYDCISLMNVSIPNSVTSIGDYAFYNCNSLTSVTIPNSIANIGNSAFQDCWSLAKVYISDLSAWCNITFNGYNANPLYYAKNLYINGAPATDIRIPNEIKEIKEYAFCNCGNLKNITISNSVTKIGDSAFSGCRNLISASIGNGVKNIGEQAFCKCYNLTSITIPDSVTLIRSNTFSGCTGLEELTIKANNVSSCAFEDSCNLKKIYFSKNLLTVSVNAFKSAIGITDIYYEGTAEEWKNILINPSNISLSTATVHYNSTGILSVCAMEIHSKPTKLKYALNTESLDLTGGYVKVSYKNGSFENIEMSRLEVTGFDNTKAGNCELTLSYDGFGVKLTVEIVAPKALFITTISTPAKLFYKLGEEIDVTGGKLAIGYDDGKWEYADITADMLTGYKSEKYGEQEITVAYKACMAKFTVETYRTGDIDGDEHIGASDIAKLRECLLSVITGNAKFDVNSDGETDIRDLVRIKKLAVG